MNSNPSRFRLGVALAGLLAVSPQVVGAADPAPAAEIQQDLRAFREMGTVLHVAAHPDDENTQLIAYLARGRGCRTGYLSLTRGDGGQNVLGSDLGERLGVARTQELMEARRLDGGRQFFTRALDFGFSKDYVETLKIWDKQEVLSDMVRVIRTFRPDVLITRFSPQPSGTHGHHTASAVLAVEAFKLAGDAKAFPEQLGELKPWQPKRIFMNGRGGGGANVVQMDIGGNDPVLGISFAALAGQSRGMHKTQGFGGGGGGGGGGGSRMESFQLLGGEPATTDIFDGVDTTWSRVAGGAEIGRLTGEILAKFNDKDPSASVPALLDLRTRLAAVPTDPVVADKRRDLDHILQACLGLTVKTTIAQAEVVPGETLKMQHTATVRSAVPVRWTTVRYPAGKGQGGDAINLRSDQPATREATQALPASTPLSQPYWLRTEHTAGMFRVAETGLIGRPQNPPAFPIENVFEVGGQTLVIQDEPIQMPAGPDQKESRLKVIPPISLRFTSDVQVFGPGASRPVTVEVTSARAGSAGTVQLDAPTGWVVSPANRPFRLAAAGDKAEFTFNVVAPAKPATAVITARAQVGDLRLNSQRVEVRYNHLPLLLLQPPARLKAVSLDLAIRGKQVGYVAGAGDAVAESLTQMGYTVHNLAVGDLTPERLRELDCVVLGIRAFDTKRDLIPKMSVLFAYAEAGGNVIVQYNRVDGLLNTPLTLRISQSRVTDENAPVTILAPDHPVLNTPNKITSADFDGWVQERGIYFPSQWDDRFIPILACGDAGETPLKSGLLVAKYGKGNFIYTGLVWFRQLPEGVPGAFRIFANLVSLGK